MRLAISKKQWILSTKQVRSWRLFKKVDQPSVVLKPGREKSPLKKHPWIFSGAVQQVNGNPKDGETVGVYSSSGDFLAWGAFSSQSQIQVRIWDWDIATSIDASFIRNRLSQSIQARTKMPFYGKTDAYRLVHAESDGLPGLMVDRYGDILVVQLLSCGVEFWKAEVVESLAEITGIKTFYERSDVDVRKLEGLASRSGYLGGNLVEPLIQINEWDSVYQVDIQNGHKTGFYLDQRTNRKVLQDFVNNADVLDCFCYTGGFTVNALKGGAKSVVAVDSSAQALELASQNIQINGFDLKRTTFIEGDCFGKLREFRDRNLKFDLIILDPPKFAPTSAQVERASRAYKDINLLGFKLLRPGGFMFTFSCSGGIGQELFQKIVSGAAFDAGVDARIIGMLHQDADHPIALNFPEGQYLKGLILQVQK
jgi:23S rRNA (cytosine1962-C5)-methyltransferase